MTEVPSEVLNPMTIFVILQAAHLLQELVVLNKVL